jgi:selenocysteine-specific elongation factor
VGDEVEIFPTGRRARVRGLQSHKRSLDAARPVARVAVNLVGIEREDLERGDVLGRPGAWRPTSVLEARLRPVRGLDHPLTGRGAFKLYAGSAERDARVRFLGTTRLEPADSGGAFVRVRLSAPLVLEPGDRFVLRESGRRATVAGGVALDTEPPARPGPDPVARLERRETAAPDDLPALLVDERGAVRATDLSVLTGRSRPPSKAPRGPGHGGSPRRSWTPCTTRSPRRSKPSIANIRCCPGLISPRRDPPPRKRLNGPVGALTPDSSTRSSTRWNRAA